MARAAWITAAAVTFAGVFGGMLSAATAADRGCPDVNAPVAQLPLARAQRSLACAIIQQREAHGLPPLTVSTRLDNSAQSWIVKLVADDLFDHGNIAARFHSAGVRFSVAGEDLATGQPTIAAAVAAWMASPPHCQNILNPEYRRIGTGIVGHPILGFATGAASWAADFSLPMHRRAPSHNWRPADHCPY